MCFCQIVTTLVMSIISAVTLVYYIPLTAFAIQLHDATFSQEEYADEDPDPGVPSGIITLRFTLCTYIIMHLSQSQYCYMDVLSPQGTMAT